MTNFRKASGRESEFSSYGFGRSRDEGALNTFIPTIAVGGNGEILIAHGSVREIFSYIILTVVRSLNRDAGFFEFR